jgi:hypothetical protein
MKITAEFLVESGGKILRVGLTADVMDCDLQYLDSIYQRMSKQLSKDVIKNTTMLAHLVTHPDDMP